MYIRQSYNWERSNCSSKTGVCKALNVVIINTKPNNDVFTFGVWKNQKSTLQMPRVWGNCGQMHRRPFGIEKLDHTSDRWSVSARADRADRAVKVINNLKMYIRNKLENNCTRLHIPTKCNLHAYQDRLSIATPSIEHYPGPQHASNASFHCVWCPSAPKSVLKKQLRNCSSCGHRNSGYAALRMPRTRSG